MSHRRCKRCGHPEVCHGPSGCLVRTNDAGDFEACRCGGFVGSVDPVRSERARAAQRKGEDEERAVKKTFGKLGGIVYKLSESGIPKGKHRRRGTMKTPGTSDFLVFFPQHGLAILWESKAGTSRLSKVQREFRDLVQRCPTLVYGWGDRDRVKTINPEDYHGERR